MRVKCVDFLVHPVEIWNPYSFGIGFGILVEVQYDILKFIILYTGIVDVHTNNELFYTVLDMLSALIHSTLVSLNADSVENSKKPYQLLIKKIKVSLKCGDLFSIFLL